MAEANVWELAVNGIVAAMIAVAALVLTVTMNRHLSRLHQRNRVSTTLLLPMRFFLRYGILLITLLAILSVFRVNIGSLWQFISAVLGLIAIGFVAVWSLLSNFASAFLLLVFKPFKIGDQLELMGEAVSGRVMDMSIMFTVIKDSEGRLYNIPNNMFFQKTSRKTPGPADSAKPTNDQVQQIDHSQANLEGINLPSTGRNR